jgi:hypothetical protein
MSRKTLTMDGAGVEAMAKGALVPDDDELLNDGELFDERPPGVCPACMGLSPGIAIDGETIMHCRVCNDTGKVTSEEAERYWQAVKARERRREGNG